MVATKLKPQLRFPEFSDSWSAASIDGISEFVTSGSRGWAQFYSPKGAKFIRMTNLDRNNIKLSLDDLRFVELPAGSSEGSRTSLVPKDILISITAELGKIGIVPDGLGEAYINQHTALVRIGRNIANPMFIAYKMTTRASNNRLNRMNDSGAKAGLNLGTIRKFTVNVPGIEEQEKIAEFLTTVDERVALQDKKVELLQKYKKSVMQKIFSQKIRFKDENGNDYPDWEENKLGELGKFSSGQGFSEVEQGGESGTPFYKVSDMNLAGNEHEMTTANHYVDEEQVDRLKYKKVAKSSIIFAKVGAAIFLERKRLAKDFILDNNMMSFTPTGDVNFMKHIFSILRLSKYAQVGALPSYNSSDLAIIKILIPRLDEEQQKIADFLTALDDKINFEKAKLNEAKKFKKALLQRMFA